MCFSPCCDLTTWYRLILFPMDLSPCVDFPQLFDIKQFPGYDLLDTAASQKIYWEHVLVQISTTTLSSVMSNRCCNNLF